LLEHYTDKMIFCHSVLDILQECIISAAQQQSRN